MKKFALKVFGESDNMSCQGLLDCSQSANKFVNGFYRFTDVSKLSNNKF
jgi:hypothetical protein